MCLILWRVYWTSPTNKVVSIHYCLNLAQYGFCCTSQKLGQWESLILARKLSPFVPLPIFFLNQGFCCISQFCEPTRAADSHLIRQSQSCSSSSKLKIWGLCRSSRKPIRLTYTVSPWRILMGASGNTGLAIYYGWRESRCLGIAIFSTIQRNLPLGKTL